MTKEQIIEEALKAAPPGVKSTAKVVDDKGNVLRDGTSAYTCMLVPDAMCLDSVWADMADAWINKKPFSTDRIGIGYMLVGDVNGSSNSDPYAEDPTTENDWVVEGPHVMIIVPDPSELEGLPDTPTEDGAYVMWKGTPYAHIMLPVGARPAQRMVGN
ncbi:MAG: hypothetical protein NPIRA03_37100 [Nitrospirales bacterium]|nr:MAG: hypothetical protein NPIRA03_37100 [Nitrospirales bacterium]